MKKAISFLFVIGLFVSACASSKDYFDKGMANYNNKEYALAVTNFSKAIELDTKNMDAYYYRGKSYKFLGDRKSAMRDFVYFTTASPDEAYSNANTDSNTNLMEKLDAMTTNEAVTQ